jgi:hypothetical protein
MYRAIALCLPLLLVCGAAAADDAAGAKKTPQATAGSRATAVRSDRAIKSATSAKADSPPKADSPAKADSPPGTEAARPAGDVKMSGMSILGNEDSPKSLVIVPWKSSQMGDMPGVSRLLDPTTQPVDKDVFMRELAYYEIKASAP